MSEREQEREEFCCLNRTETDLHHEIETDVVQCIMGRREPYSENYHDACYLNPPILDVVISGYRYMMYTFPRLKVSVVFCVRHKE